MDNSPDKVKTIGAGRDENAVVAIRHRGGLFLILLAAALLGCVGWMQLTLWRSNRVSPQFTSTARSAYRLVEDCDERISADGPSFSVCLKTAEDAVVPLSKLGVTQQEAKETLHCMDTSAHYANAVAISKPLTRPLWPESTAINSLGIARR